MPLHLLGKKSWNIYNPAAIAQVRADEAAAAAAEEARDQQLREHDAACRLALLRGEEPPPEPIATVPTTNVKEEKKDSRKRKRLAGEDDTDRDIRFAREDVENKKPGHGSRPVQNASLTDHAGNIQLFAPPSTSQIKAQQNAEVDKEKRQKARVEEAQYSLKFENAIGTRGNVKDKPWYAGDFATAQIGKTAFGNDDPDRYRRDAVRLNAADPMVAMAQAQRRIKANQRRREIEDAERQTAIEKLLRDEKRRRRHGDVEDFSLDKSRSSHKKHRSHSKHKN